VPDGPAEACRGEFDADTGADTGADPDSDPDPVTDPDPDPDPVTDPVTDTWRVEAWCAARVPSSPPNCS